MHCISPVSTLVMTIMIQTKLFRLYWPDVNRPCMWSTDTPTTPMVPSHGYGELASAVEYTAHVSRASNADDTDRRWRPVHMSPIPGLLAIIIKKVLQYHAAAILNLKKIYCNSNSNTFGNIKLSNHKKSNGSEHVNTHCHSLVSTHY